MRTIQMMSTQDTYGAIMSTTNYQSMNLHLDHLMILARFIRGDHLGTQTRTLNLRFLPQLLADLFIIRSVIEYSL